MTLTAPGPPRPLARGTLSRALVLRVTALAALVAVGLSALTAFVAHSIQISQVDARLDAAASREPGGPGPAGGGLGGGPGGGGQEIGTVIASRIGGSISGLILMDRAGSDRVRFQPLSLAALQRLGDLRAESNEKVTLVLPGYGPYRVLVRGDSAATVLIGVPLAQLTAAMTRLLIVEGLLTALTILAAFLAARAVVVRALAPLNRLAAAATTISTLELGRGEVRMPVRVAPPDTDPASEVGRVGLAFNQMLDNVEGALAVRHASESRVRQFVADASHELRNPLAAIRGYAELTRRERDDVSPTLSHALARIESESDRMSSLVEDLLLLARLDSGPALDLAPTDVTAIVLDAVSDARVAGPDHHWSLALPDGPVLAYADANRLHQVVANLLANARTHTPPGTRVQASLHATATQAVIGVADDGPGIPEELRATVFERFTRAEVSRVRREGSSTGLGLAIVAAVVAAHAGEAEVQSGPAGTRFTVRVPLAGGGEAQGTLET